MLAAQLGCLPDGLGSRILRWADASGDAGLKGRNRLSLLDLVWLIPTAFGPDFFGISKPLEL